MLNILITGHRGYIGSALTRYLQQQSIINNVVGYDLVEGDDIMNVNKLTTVMIRENITVVIHLAAQSSISSCNDDPELANQINGTGTNNVLTAMKNSGCSNIIYASTSSVYGNESNQQYIESNYTVPCSSYGSSKLLGELAILNHYSDKNITGGYLLYRMFNVVGTSGYSDIDNSVHPGYDRLFGALQTGKVTIYGQDYDTVDGTCQRDYISLKDICNAYLQGAVKLSTTNNIRNIINICTSNPISVMQIIASWNSCHNKILIKDLAYTLCNKLPYITFTIGARRIGDPSVVYGSNSKAKEVLNWQPIRKIDDIIRDIAIDKRL